MRVNLRSTVNIGRLWRGGRGREGGRDELSRGREGGKRDRWIDCRLTIEKTRGSTKHMFVYS